MSFKSISAVLTVGIGVVAGYQRYADDAIALPSGFRYQTEIFENTSVSLTRVVAVNVGVYILDVDNQGVDYWEQRFDVGSRHIERCLQVELPCGATQLAELTDKLRTQARLPAAECYAAVCRDEIKFVNVGLGIELFRRKLAETSAVA